MRALAVTAPPDWFGVCTLGFNNVQRVRTRTLPTARPHNKSRPACRSEQTFEADVVAVVAIVVVVEAVIGEVEAAMQARRGRRRISSICPSTWKRTSA